MPQSSSNRGQYIRSPCRNASEEALLLEALRTSGDCDAGAGFGWKSRCLVELSEKDSEG
jgi:hypothetical protein